MRVLRCGKLGKHIPNFAHQIINQNSAPNRTFGDLQKHKKLCVSLWFCDIGVIKTTKINVLKRGSNNCRK